MKRETRTFEQILLALYQKYATNQEMLKQLKECIEVAPDKKIERVNFVPQFELYGLEPHKRYVYHDKLIRLEITEKLDLLKRIKEEFIRCSDYISDYDISQFLRKLYYNIERDGNGDYHIKFEHNGELTSTNPQINIIHQARFNDLINEILNSELMSIGRQECNPNEMIGGWKFFMDADYIGLRGPQKKVMNIYDIQQKIEFLPQENTVIISSPGENKFLFELLYEEPIPCFCFDETAKKMIECNLKKNSRISFENDHVEYYGKNVFNIEQHDDGLKLVRKKTK